MAHTPAFSKLRRLFATAAWAHRHGVPVQRAREAFDAAVDRRTVLKGGAGLAAVAAVPGCTVDPANVSVAVVGAGIAGLHCAWRLHQAGFDVRVYEGQDRVGGRMWTGRGLFDNGMDCEIGGELIDSNHATLWAIADELGIAITDRWSWETPGMERDTWYVGDRHVDTDTLLEQAVQVMDLMASQVDDAESDDAAFETLDAIPLSDWLDTHVPRGAMPELHDVLWVAFVGEYGLEAEEQSCLNLLYLFGWDSPDEFLIFGASDERWHTHDGNDTFPTRIAAEIGSDRIHVRSRLTSVSGQPIGPFTLTFTTDDDATVEVVADHVVFAIPFTKLREVDLSGLTLTAEKVEIIQNIGYGTNAKVMGGFSRRPWWEDHNQSGLLTTDLPPQQGWDSSIGQSGDGGVWTNFLGGNQGVASGNGTPQEWFAAIAADLDAIWPGTLLAWTGQTVRMHWPTFEWAKGSYTCYKPGQWAYWSLEGAREGNVHFCGEHCSLEFQGWMEGAAESGGVVAAEILDDYGVAHPEGLTAAVGEVLAAERVVNVRLLPPRQRWRAHKLARRAVRK